MAEENLTEKCARCGHTREEHAQFIDNQVGSKTYVPERRKCLHHELKSGVACYDCECHHFLTESEKRAQDAQDAVLMPDLEKHVKAAAEALDDADVEKKFPSTAVELARKCGIETTEFGAVSVLDSYIVGLQEMVTQLKDQAVDKDTLAQLKRAECLFNGDAEDPFLEYLDDRIRDWRGRVKSEDTEQNRAYVDAFQCARTTYSGHILPKEPCCERDHDGDGNCDVHPEQKMYTEEDLEGVDLQELRRTAEKMFQAQIKRLEKNIVGMARSITVMVDTDQPTKDIEQARSRIRQMCRNLEKECKQREKLKHQSFAAAYGMDSKGLKKVLADTRKEYDMAKDGPSVVTIDQAGMEKKLSSNAKAHAEEREQSKLDEERERKEAIASFQETERSIIGADCTKCGACCCPPPDAGLEGNLYVELTHSDLVRLGPSAGPHLGPSPGKGRSPNTSGYHLRAYKDNDGQVRCPFFVGDVGDEIHNCGCGIYEQRPYACQLFPKGGDGCRIARRSHPRINPHLRELSWKTKQPTPKYHQGVTNELLESERYARQAEAADSIDMKVEVGEGEKLTHFVHDEFVLEKTDESAAASE